jgi:hypothetical protein
MKGENWILRICIKKNPEVFIPFIIQRLSITRPLSPSADLFFHYWSKIETLFFLC